jgi:hypothetical protein
MGYPAFPVPESENPVVNAVAITPSDAVALTRSPRALYVGTGGNIAVKLRGDGDTILHKNVPGGSILPVCVTHVMATNTTATDIVGWF